MTVDREARAKLRHALVSYMTGETRTFAFDDQNSSPWKDDSVRQISRFLYQLHDDLVDHPISVSPDAWAYLRRIVAFLDTDLEVGAFQGQPSWPFRDEKEWQATRTLEGIDLPAYDPQIHGRQVHPWWDRIPSSVGFLVLGGIVVAVMVAIANL